jgi:hypothetical protein
MRLTGLPRLVLRYIAAVLTAILMALLSDTSNRKTGRAPCTISGVRSCAELQGLHAGSASMARSTENSITTGPGAPREAISKAAPGIDSLFPV